MLDPSTINVIKGLGKNYNKTVVVINSGTNLKDLALEGKDFIDTLKGPYKTEDTYTFTQSQMDAILDYVRKSVHALRAHRGCSDITPCNKQGEPTADGA